MRTESQMELRAVRSTPAMLTNAVYSVGNASVLLPEV